MIATPRLNAADGLGSARTRRRSGALRGDDGGEGGDGDERIENVARRKEIATVVSTRQEHAARAALSDMLAARGGTPVRTTQRRIGARPKCPMVSVQSLRHRHGEHGTAAPGTRRWSGSVREETRVPGIQRGEDGGPRTISPARATRSQEPTRADLARTHGADRLLSSKYGRNQHNRKILGQPAWKERRSS